MRNEEEGIGRGGEGRGGKRKGRKEREGKGGEEGSPFLSWMGFIRQL